MSKEPLKLQGAIVFVDATARSAQLSSSIRDHGAVETRDVEKAAILVTASMQRGRDLIIWRAVLGGLTIALASQLMSGHGAYVAYSSCMAIRREVYVSDAFLEAHPRVSEIILTRMAHPQTAKAWKWIRTEAMCKARAAATKGKAVLAFLTDVEVADADRLTRNRKSNYIHSDEWQTARSCSHLCMHKQALPTIYKHVRT